MLKYIILYDMKLKIYDFKIFNYIYIIILKFELINIYLIKNYLITYMSSFLVKPSS